MRSHPYEPPPPFPPILNTLASLLPEPPPTYQPYGASSEGSVQLSELDHDTSRLVPEQKQRHHVWIQGKLTPVRSASAANLSLDPNAIRTKKRETMRDLETPRRRSMGDDQWPGDEDETGSQGEHRLAMRQSKQLRGYGIGGAGNIRRPTDVIHGPTKQSDSLWSMCFSPRDTTTTTTDSNDGKWSIRDMFSKKADRRGKQRGQAAAV